MAAPLCEDTGGAFFVIAAGSSAVPIGRQTVSQP